MIIKVILRIDPFRVVEKDKEDYCFYKYNGDEFLGYDKYRKCFIFLPDFEPHHLRDTVMTTPNARCSDKIFDKQDWTKTGCTSVLQTDEQRLIQVKTDLMFNYIYAPYQRFSFRGQTIRALNQVYRLSQTENFTLNDQVWSFSQQKTGVNIDLDTTLNQMANTLLVDGTFPALNTSELSTWVIDEKAEEKRVELSFNMPTTDFTMNGTNIFSLIAVCIAILVVITVIVTCCCKQNLCCCKCSIPCPDCPDCTSCCQRNSVEMPRELTRMRAAHIIETPPPFEEISVATRGINYSIF